MYPLAALLFFFLPLSLWAASPEQWRGRSIYQLITDRFALPPGADTTACDVNARTWCGGTWKTITDNLDYIQGAGFTAIWISPVNQNYQGPPTPYGDPYHGYWMADVSQLNSRFGSADDLKALSAALHRRDMYLMVDVVVNDVMATSVTPDFSTYLFKQKEQYHPLCWIDFSNATSEEQCWFGDKNVPLPDLNTEDPSVVDGFKSWIQNMVQEYGIDGLRIDAAKHVNVEFWPPFSQAAGVFCLGEVFDQNATAVAQWQGPQALHAVLQYPMYQALTDAFRIPGPLNISAVADMVHQSQAAFPDTGLLGNFLENQDVPRWHNISVDAQSMYNPLVFNFMSDGIPIVYYGQEQSFTGASDPANREPLWTSNYTKTDAYNLISTLNRFRKFLVTQSNSTSPDSWLHSKAQVMTVSSIGIAIMKGKVVTIVTNIGSPPRNETITVMTPFQSSSALINILTCEQWVVGSNGSVSVEYTKGGVPAILYPSALLTGSGLCVAEAASTNPTITASALSDRLRLPVGLSSWLVFVASIALFV